MVSVDLGGRWALRVVLQQLKRSDPSEHLVLQVPWGCAPGVLV